MVLPEREELLRSDLHSRFVRADYLLPKDRLEPKARQELSIDSPTSSPQLRSEPPTTAAASSSTCRYFFIFAGFISVRLSLIFPLCKFDKLSALQVRGRKKKIKVTKGGYGYAARCKLIAYLFAAWSEIFFCPFFAWFSSSTERVNIPTYPLPTDLYTGERSGSTSQRKKDLQPSCSLTVCGLCLSVRNELKLPNLSKMYPSTLILR